MPPLQDLQWEANPVPPAPVGLAARGDAALRLARRLLDSSPERLEPLTGISAPGLLLVLGPEELLPWCEGAVYLGRSPEAPGLLVPTVQRPRIPLPLLERGVRARWPELAPPVALLPAWGLAVSAAEARSVVPGVLAAWLEAAEVTGGTR
jgi:hypothetical protein